MKSLTYSLPIADRIVTGENLIDTTPRYTHLRGEVAIHAAGYARTENGGPVRPSSNQKRLYDKVRVAAAAQSGIVGVATLEEVIPADRIRVRPDQTTQWRWDYDWIIVDQDTWDGARTGRGYVYLFSTPTKLATKVHWKGDSNRRLTIPADTVCPSCRALVRYDPDDPTVDALDLHTWWHLPADLNATVTAARAMP